tara:strand:- start:34575 stop:35453 length:879 start_codon:yes stop_codon:yes gene_type:complete
MFSLLDIGINEVALHSSLWRTISSATTSQMSLIRLKMLHGAMAGATSYLDALLQTPQPVLFQLALNTWASWFYAVIIICKLVFLQENERLGRTQLEEIPEEIDNLIPQSMDAEPLADYVTPPTDGAEQSGWNAVSVAHEYRVGDLFERFMKKLRFILPEGDIPWHRLREERESLYALACIQQVMLNGYKKRMGPLTSTTVASAPTNQAAITSQTGSQGLTGAAWQPSLPTPDEIHVNATAPIPLAPYASFMNFDAINFDGIMLPSSTVPPQIGEEVLGDWMWDKFMDDLTMP